MTDTATNGQAGGPALTAAGWPVAAEVVGLAPNGGRPPVPAPPAPLVGPPPGPAGPIPVAVAEPTPDPPAPPAAPAAAPLAEPGTTVRVVEAAQPEAASGAQMPAPTPRVAVAYPVGAWSAGPPVEGEAGPPVQSAPAGPTGPSPGAAPGPAAAAEPPTPAPAAGPRLHVSMPRWLANGRKRSRVLTVAGLAILAVVVLNTCAGRFSAGLYDSIERGAEQGAKAGATAAGPRSDVQTVVIPTDWWPCPLTGLGETAIGHTAAGTVDPERSTYVAGEVKKRMSEGASIPNLWISTPAPDAINVTAVELPDSAKLFDCRSGATSPRRDDSSASSSSATSAPSTATSAPR